MDSLEKARELLAGEFHNVFILVEDADGGIIWSGSDLFGEGACRRFLRLMTEDQLNAVVDLDDDDEVED